MPEKRPILIPATEGAGFIVRRGETLKVIDVEGHQIGDFICFNLFEFYQFKQLRGAADQLFL
jgi:uncharacterized protein YcgI (DUF1989 family)